MNLEKNIRQISTISKATLDKAISVGILIDETCTQDLLSLILREDYNIIVQVKYTMNLISNDKIYCEPKLISISDNNIRIIYCQKGVSQKIFTSYDNALEYGLLSALNHI